MAWEDLTPREVEAVKIGLDLYADAMEGEACEALAVSQLVLSYSDAEAHVKAAEQYEEEAAIAKSAREKLRPSYISS